MYVLDRAAKDPGFNQRVREDPEGTLGRFDLTPEEIAALTSGDPDLLRAVGLDERIAQWLPWRPAQEVIPEFAEPPFTSMRPWQEPGEAQQQRPRQPRIVD
jgi:hypothetical protein